MERELLVEKAGSKGWSISDDGILISCHATSQDVMAEAFRLSEMRNPSIKITVDCKGE
jgi:predicted secreted protein